MNILHSMTTTSTYLNIGRDTAYGKEAHPSIHRMRMIYKMDEEWVAAKRARDCSHWFLPGLAVTWNELLYASILQSCNESWNRGYINSLCDVMWIKSCISNEADSLTWLLFLEHLLSFGVYACQITEGKVLLYWSELLVPSKYSFENAVFSLRVLTVTCS